MVVETGSSSATGIGTPLLGLGYLAGSPDSRFPSNLPMIAMMWGGFYLGKSAQSVWVQLWRCPLSISFFIHNESWGWFRILRWIATLGGATCKYQDCYQFNLGHHGVGNGRGAMEVGIVTHTACVYHVETCWSLNITVLQCYIYYICPYRLCNTSYGQVWNTCRLKCCDVADLFQYMGFAPTSARMRRSSVNWAQLVNRVETKGENKARKWRSCIKLPVAMLLCISFDPIQPVDCIPLARQTHIYRSQCHFILVSQ